MTSTVSFTKPLRRRRGFNYLLKFLHNLGLFTAVIRTHPRVLTVLNYHRVNDVTQPGFDTFSPNVTATTEGFHRQLEFVQRHFHPISCVHLAQYLQGERELPPNPVLLTFDDGYADNFTHAYPILKALNLPAIIFLTTDFIGNSQPFYWDLVAYCFFHTQKHSVNLPYLGEVSWSDPEMRNRILKEWIERNKDLPELDKQKAVEDLVSNLDVVVPSGAFSDLYLNWEQVRSMSQNGIELGSHSASHPILTRISLSQVETELLKSKQKIEIETGQPVFSFAYPNGNSADFSADVISLLQKTGYQMAFSLEPGINIFTQLKKEPFAIRRIFLGASDIFPRFVAKLALSGFHKF